MAKANIKLPNGTTVIIEGTPEEVAKLLEFYGGSSPAATASAAKRRVAKTSKKHKAPAGKPDDQAPVDLPQIVNLVKSCDEAELIETQILDRTSQVDRTLLPLYVAHEYLGNEFAMTSGEVSRITTDLGIPILQPNASRILSKTASRYVIGDKVRKKGQPVRYKLSRRGIQYIKSVLKGNQGEK